jgi:thiosulfate/3-mercaptopyruvate sulfurtransferase
MQNSHSILVETDELQQMLDSGTPVQVLNVTHGVEGAFESHCAERICEHAVFYDIDEIANKSLPFPNTCPSQETFVLNMKKLGIRTSEPLVVYDNKGMYSAPRVFTLFKYFGHPNVRILNGGFKKWKAEGRPTAHGEQVLHGNGDTAASEGFDYTV